MNVLVYVSDALRIDHLGCYAARFLDTRMIDELPPEVVEYPDLGQITAQARTSSQTGERLWFIRDMAGDG